MSQHDCLLFENSVQISLYIIKQLNILGLFSDLQYHLRICSFQEVQLSKQHGNIYTQIPKKNKKLLALVEPT